MRGAGQGVAYPPKGPFTFSDCDAAAISLRNQMYVFNSVLLHTAFVTATATATATFLGGSLCEQFKSDIAVILESQSQSLYVNGL